MGRKKIILQFDLEMIGKKNTYLGTAFALVVHTSLLLLSIGRDGNRGGPSTGCLVNLPLRFCMNGRR